MAKPLIPSPDTSQSYLHSALAWLQQLLTNYLQSPTPPSPFHKTEKSKFNPTPAFIILSQSLNLSEFEQNILLLCLAYDINPAFAQLYATAQQDDHCPYPTFALAFSLFEHPSWTALTPESPLRYWKLIDLDTSRGLPLMTCPLKVDERVLHYVLGHRQIDPHLLSFLFPLSPQSPTLAPSQLLIRDRILLSLKNDFSRAIGQTNPNQERAIAPIQLLGANQTAKQAIVCQICQHFGLTPYRLTVEQIPTDPQKFDNFLRLWNRESRLLGICLYLDLETETPNSSVSKLLQRLIFHREGLIFLDSFEIYSNSEGTSFFFDLGKPTPEEQYQTWLELLGDSSEITARQLTSQFNLNLSDIIDISRQNQDINTADKLTALWQNCLATTHPRMEKLARKLELKATWNDLSLPDTITDQLQQIVAQIRRRHQVYEQWGYRKRLNRGLGVITVFAGESGTGKTMAAEVIANDLQLNLYRIDLSAVVSKYIGETEKNLRRLFDAAEGGGCILFFDEADALFGKRSEVKDSHDRYANIEINYLLQRLESYSGLAILATNKKASMDDAFMRRLRFIIDFPFPPADTRQMLWKKVFPPQAPLDELDYAYLKQIKLTGGSIQNIALNASFLAAQNGSKIGMDQVMSAIRSEFMKLERSLNELNFIKPIEDDFTDDEDDDD